MKAELCLLNVCVVDQTFIKGSFRFLNETGLRTENGRKASMGFIKRWPADENQFLSIWKLYRGIKKISGGVPWLTAKRSYHLHYSEFGNYKLISLDLLEVPYRFPPNKIQRPAETFGNKTFCVKITLS